MVKSKKYRHKYTFHLYNRTVLNLRIFFSYFQQISQFTSVKDAIFVFNILTKERTDTQMHTHKDTQRHTEAQRKRELILMTHSFPSPSSAIFGLVSWLQLNI